MSPTTTGQCSCHPSVSYHGPLVPLELHFRRPRLRVALEWFAADRLLALRRHFRAGPQIRVLVGLHVVADLLEAAGHIGALVDLGEQRRVRVSAATGLQKECG